MSGRRMPSFAGNVEEEKGWFIGRLLTVNGFDCARTSRRRQLQRRLQLHFDAAAAFCRARSAVEVSLARPQLSVSTSTMLTKVAAGALFSTRTTRSAAPS